MKRYIKNISYYIVGFILLRSVSFVLLPVFSNTLSNEQYGVYSILFVFMAFLQFVYSYGMDASFMRFSVKYKNKLKKIYSTVFISLLITSSLFSFCIYFFASHLSSLFFKLDYGNLFKIISIILFLDSFSFRVLVMYRMEEAPSKYFFLTCCNVVFTIVANYYFVYILKMGVLGALYSTLFGSLIIFLLSFPYILRKINIQYYSISILKKLLRFGLPFLPAVLFQMIIDFSDRIILSKLMGLSAVGTYSAGYKVAGIIMLLISGFRLGWEPFFLKLEKHDNRFIILSKVATLLILFLIFIMFFFLLFVESILQYNIFGMSLLGQSYWDAISIIPIIMVGYIFLGFYYLHMPGIYYYEKTYFLPVFKGCAAISNILLNIILIPSFGIIGAAYATTISFVIMYISVYFYSNRLFKMYIDWKIIISYLFICIFIALLINIYNIGLLFSFIILIISCIMPLKYYFNTRITI